MDFFSNDPKADTINRVRGEISEVCSVMVDNIDKVCCRLPCCFCMSVVAQHDHGNPFC